MKSNFMLMLLGCSLFPAIANAQAYRNFFAESGTEWLIKSYSTIPGEEDRYSLRTQILEDVDGYPGMKVIWCSVSLKEAKPLYITTEEDKVFFHPSLESSERYLMYDFSINEGETVELWSAVDFLRRGELNKSQAKCVSVTHLEENPEIQVINLLETIVEEIEQWTIEYDVNRAWYRGIGASRSPEWNSRGMVAGGGLMVSRVKACGETIFDFMNYVENTSADEMTDEMADGASIDEAYFSLQGVRVAEPTHGIFIRFKDGKPQKIVIP